jgi:hypothetical protein
MTRRRGTPASRRAHSFPEEKYLEDAPTNGAARHPQAARGRGGTLAGLALFAALTPLLPACSTRVEKNADFEI